MESFLWNLVRNNKYLLFINIIKKKVTEPRQIYILTDSSHIKLFFVVDVLPSTYSHNIMPSRKN